VGDDRIANASETRIGLEPRLVAEEAVRTRPEHNRTLVKEVVMPLRERSELGRADKREVARIEEENDPPAAVTRQRKLARTSLSPDMGRDRLAGNRLPDSERHEVPPSTATKNRLPPQG